MIRAFAVFFILAITATVSIAQAETIAAEDKAAIAGVFNEIVEAARTKDRKRLEAVYAADFVHVHASGQIDDRQTRLDQILAGEQTIDTPSKFELGYRRYGDTIIAVEKVDVGQGAQAATYAVTRVYVKIDGKWLYSSSHASAIAK